MTIGRIKVMLILKLWSKENMFKVIRIGKPIHTQ